MDKEIFMQNVNALCDDRGVYATNACRECGVGSSFLSDIKRGRIPSVDKFQKLAQYFGVTTSDLLGETYVKQLTGEVIDVPFTISEPQLPAPAPELETLSAALEQLNEEGQEKLLDYAADLVASGRYKKAGPDRLDQEA